MKKLVPHSNHLMTPKGPWSWSRSIKLFLKYVKASNTVDWLNSSFNIHPMVSRIAIMTFKLAIYYNDLKLSFVRKKSCTSCCNSNFLIACVLLIWCICLFLCTGSLPFRCLVCSQRFRTSGHRKAHLLTHVRENQAQLKKNSLIPTSELAPTAPTDNNTAEDIPTENTAVTLENMVTNLILLRCILLTIVSRWT